jgi:voltage-gated sodium channel
MSAGAADASKRQLSEKDKIRRTAYSELSVRNKWRKLSDQLETWVRSVYFVNFITFVIVLAGAIVGAQTYPSIEYDPHLRAVFEALDDLILLVFTAEAGLKILSFDLRPYRYFATSFHPNGWAGWNIFDFAIVVASWAMDSNMATLLRLLRLLRVLKLVKAVKSLQMILSGLYKGIKSIGYILVLLLLVFYLFGILAMILFRGNDPQHFGSLGLTLLSLFRMATLEDWTDIMYINMFGCDVYGYGDVINSTDYNAQNLTDLEEMLIPPCDEKFASATGFASAIFFIFFTIVSALVVMSLFIGVVTTTMMEASSDMQRDEKTKKSNKKKDMKKLERTRTTLNKLELFKGGEAPPELEPEPVKAGCCGIGPQDDHSGVNCTGYGKISHKACTLRDHNSFQVFIIFVICVAGVLVGIQTYPSAVTSTGGTCTPPGSDECDGGVLKAVDWVILIIFTLEVFLKIVAEHSKPLRYFYSSGWNLFDFFIVAMCYMPFAGRAVAVLRLLRLLRVLKLVKQLPQLQMIVQGLLKGLSSIGYISLLLGLFFYLGAVLGIILFRENDPWHFSTLDVAMLTLFRCATLEDWTDVMYTNMYGCDKYGYDLWETMQEDLCKQPQAQELGAAIFFLVFIVIASLVMLSLFIGVVTTSMSESAELMKKEEETKKKVKKLIKAEKLSEDDAKEWGRVFDTFDRDDSKSIDTEEMMWVMTAVGADTELDETTGKKVRTSAGLGCL